MTDTQTLEAQLFMQVARRLPVTLVRGQGTRVWDVDGKEYLDFVAGISTCTFGHADPGVVAAITEQAGKLIHTSNIFYTEPQIELAQLLIDNSPLDRVFFSNSGSEAVEGAMKLARKWGRVHRDGAYEIIATHNGFHGRTMGAVTATGTAAYREPFEPLVPGILHVDFDDVEAIQAATTPQTVAVLLEPIQAEGGIIVPGDGYLRGIRKWCDEQNILLILDEVQVGMGRTGTLWAHEQAGIEPDIMTSAKALGGGVPISAVLAKEHAAAFEPGDHGTTFGGQPLTTAVAAHVVRRVIEGDTLQNVRERGAQATSRLTALGEKHAAVRGVR
ncbi:MAG: aminotransferase class III-fold pyridoxal phosphate-dependent enzyme, partial [Chloroflexi bacterium]|nr:aminotransferase class III-fold pyridoxal phosphate-dependent enzyme [Chloroflexota bacterium]